MHLTTLPQDPVMLSGMVRDNFDTPSLAPSKEERMSAVEKVFLWEIINGGAGLGEEFDTLGLSRRQQ